MTNILITEPGSLDKKTKWMKIQSLCHLYFYMKFNFKRKTRKFERNLVNKQAIAQLTPTSFEFIEIKSP